MLFCVLFSRYLIFFLLFKDNVDFILTYLLKIMYVWGKQVLKSLFHHLNVSQYNCNPSYVSSLLFYADGVSYLNSSSVPGTYP